MIIYECCGRTVHTDDVWTICGRIFLPTSLRINTKQWNEITKPPREWNSQPSDIKLKSWTSSQKPVVWFWIWLEIINHPSIDNGVVKVCTSYYPSESNCDSFPYPDTTPIIPIYDDEMDHPLEICHSDQDDDIFDIEFQMIQTWIAVSSS